MDSCQWEGFYDILKDNPNAERTVAEMTEEKDIRTMVDEDIAHGEAVWDASSYDSEAMEALFDRLMEHYGEKIEGFTKRLRVNQLYEEPADQAEIYRKNVKEMMERLKDFRENDYSNEGLMEYRMQRDREELNYEADFMTVRLALGMMEGLSLAEKEDIMKHLDEMETICARVRTKTEKWEELREHMVWLSGKEVRVAMKILPLFFRIN